MKKIMILGASRYMKTFIEHALETYEVVVVSPEIPENIAALPVKLYYVDVMDCDRVLEIAREERIDGVTTEQAERPVRTVAYVADAMGLPGNGYDVACLFTDKTAMRRKLVEGGVGILPYREATTPDETLAAFREVGSPAIVKPADNRGSRGITRVDSEGELGPAFEEALANSLSGTVFVERYVDGHEVVVEGLAVNGRCTTIAVGDSIPFGIEGVFSPRERVFPSRLAPEVVERVRGLNTQILELFGLTNGISQSEYMVDGDEVYFIESCARCGGMFVGADLTTVTSGVDTADFIIRVAMGDWGDELPVSRDTGKVCAYLAFYLPEGVVEGIEGLAEVRSLPFVRNGVTEPIEIGMRTKPIVDKTARYCVVIEADSHDDYEEKKALVKSLLKIKVRSELGIEGPIWE